MVDNQINTKSLRFKKNPFHDRILVETKVLSDQRTYLVREYRDRYFFPDEWKAFEDCLKEKQVPTFRCLINTGARINEIRNVQVKDIDFERNNIVFRWTKTRNNDGSRKIRTIPISPQFTKYLKALTKDMDREAYLPILSTPAANAAMKKALIKAGIPDWKMFSIHNIRKTLEMFLLALEVQEYKVEKHMGHSLKVAMKHYVSTEIFNWDDKNMIREIIGDLYREMGR